MNVTFILGNGFDIQLGLQSRYSDFLQEYVKITPGDNDNIKKFKQHLAQKPTQELWSDAEAAMGTYLKQYTDATIEDYIERIENFEFKMIGYLELQQTKCSFSEPKEVANVFDDFLLNSFGDVLTQRKQVLNIRNKNERIVYRFITFNYTNLLECIKKCCVTDNSAIRTRNIAGSKYSDTWGPIFHVHGTLQNQIIMGVNDESQLDLSGGVTLTEALRWALIKPTLNHDSGGNFDLPAKKALSESDIIAIYGVSYGKTDQLWWEELVSWLRLDSNHKLVVFMRDKQEQFIPKLAWTELRYEKNKRRDILKKLGIEQNDPYFDTIIEQVFVIINTTRLNLKEILIPQVSNNNAIVASTAPNKTAAI